MEARAGAVAVLDLTGLDTGAGAEGTASEVALAGRLREACIQHGFFYLAPRRLAELAEMFRVAAGFLPAAEQKRTVLASSRVGTLRWRRRRSTQSASRAETQRGFT